jgi:hypothetical protein
MESNIGPGRNMTVYIHVGIAKTGTTSIQHAFKQNARRLRSEYSINFPGKAVNHWAILLPFVDHGTYDPLQNHILMGMGSKATFLARGDKLVRGLKRDARRYRTHVISSEQLLTDDHAAVARLRAFFDGLGLESKIVAYVRHPADRISSLVSQQIRGGETNLGRFKDIDTLTPAFRTYIDVFGKENMIVRRFDRRDFVNGDLIDDFTPIVNGTPIPRLNAEWLNESLSVPAVMLAEKLTETYPRNSGSRAPTQYLLRIPGPKFVAPRALVENTMRVHREYMEFLETEFGIRFDDVDLSRFPESLRWEFTEEALAAVAGIVNEQALTIRQLNAKLRRRRLDQRVRSALRLLLDFVRPERESRAS